MLRAKRRCRKRICADVKLTHYEVKITALDCFDAVGSNHHVRTVMSRECPAWTRRRKRRQHSRTQLFSSVMHLSFVQRQRKDLSPARLKISDDVGDYVFPVAESQRIDRKSTRLNSSH